MTIVCARCQRYLGTKPPYRDLRVSHALCTPCILRERREFSTLVVSRERADAVVLLDGLCRSHPDVRIVVDRRKGERRCAAVNVDACRRGTPDRRQGQSLRLV